MAKKPILSPAEKVQKDKLKNLSPKERKTFMEKVDERLKAQQEPKPAAKKAAKKAVKRARQTVSDRVKNALKSNAKAGREATQATTNAAKKAATEATKKAAQAAARTTAQAGEALVTGAGKVGGVVGRLTPALKVVGKVAAPIAAVGEAVNLANILATDEGKQAAKDYAQDMSEDGTLVRAVKAFVSPTDTIAGAGMNAFDALTSHYNESMRGAELDRTKDARVQKSIDSMNALRAARKAKMEASDEPAVPEEVKPEIRKKDARFLDRLDQRVSEELLAEPKEAEPAPTEVALEAEAEPEVDYTDEATGLFKNTHGTSFDTKSAMDREKLEKMKAALAKQGGLNGMSPNQFALKLYRSS